MIAKRKTTKRAAKKKVTARARTAAPRVKAATAKQSKMEILQAIADDTGMTRKDVSAVFTSLATMIRRHMMRRGSGEIAIPEIGLKIRKVRRAPTKKRQGINPFTGEPLVIAAKPARNVIKLTALKALKETVN
jgi:nucleoid DNA-binding protein